MNISLLSVSNQKYLSAGLQGAAPLRADLLPLDASAVFILTDGSGREIDDPHSHLPISLSLSSSNSVCDHTGSFIESKGLFAGAPFTVFSLMKIGGQPGDTINNGDIVAIFADLAPSWGQPPMGYWSMDGDKVAFRPRTRLTDEEKFIFTALPSQIELLVPTTIRVPFRSDGAIGTGTANASVFFDIPVPFGGLDLEARANGSQFLSMPPLLHAPGGTRLFDFPLNVHGDAKCGISATVSIRIPALDEKKVSTTTIRQADSSPALSVTLTQFKVVAEITSFVPITVIGQVWYKTKQWPIGPLHVELESADPLLVRVVPPVLTLTEAGGPQPFQATVLHPVTAPTQVMVSARITGTPITKGACLLIMPHK